MDRVLRTSLVPIVGALKDNAAFVAVVASWSRLCTGTEISQLDPVMLWRVIETLVARTVLRYGYEDAWQVLPHADLEWLSTRFPAHLRLGLDGPFVFTCP